MYQTKKLTKAPAYRFVAWAILTVCYLNIYMGMQTVATFSTEIIESLGCSNSIVSLISNGTTIMLAIFSIVGGALAAKIGGEKRTIMLGLIIMAISGAGFLLNPKNVPILIILRLLQGFGAGLVNVFCLAVAPWFPRKQRAFAGGVETGLYGPSLSLLTILCVAMTNIGMNWAQSTGIFVLSAAVLCIILVGLFYKDMQHKYGVSDIEDIIEGAKNDIDSSELIKNNNDIPESLKPGTYKEMLKTPSFWILAVPIFGYCYLVYNLGFVFPSLFPELGFTGSAATRLLSLTFVGTLISSPLGGIMGDRCFKGRRTATIAIGFGLSAIFMIIFLACVKSNVSMGILSIVCMIAYCAVALSPGVMWSLPVEIFKPEFASRGMGVLVFITNMGGVIGIFISSAVADATGSMMFGFILTAVVGAISCIFALIYGMKYKK